MYENLKQLNMELKNHLEEIRNGLIKDLVQMLKGENVDFLSGKTKTDTKALYFEYEYDYLDIVFWAEDQKGDIITHTMALSCQKKNRPVKVKNGILFFRKKYGHKLRIFRRNMRKKMTSMISGMNIMMKNTDCLKTGSLNAGKKLLNNQKLQLMPIFQFMTATSEQT